MAVVTECDRCKAMTRSEPNGWAVVTLIVKTTKRYDLCEECWTRLVGFLHPPAHTVPFNLQREQHDSLPPEQQQLLAEIWENAQKFDQSIGEPGVWEKRGE